MLSEPFMVGDLALRLAWPAALVFLLLPWWVSILRRRHVSESASSALKLPFIHVFPADKIDRSPPAPSQSPLRWSVGFWWGYGLLVLAAARPQWVEEGAGRADSGRDVLLVLDVSASMQTRDLQSGQKTLTRLDAATALASRFLGQQRGDRAGLIVFGRRPYLYTPLTYDLKAVGQAVDGVAAGLAGQETALGDAVGLAVSTLAGNPEDAAVARGRVAILISDGANTRGTLSPQQAAWLAAQRGVRIHTLGIGAEPDEPTLRLVAEQSGGHYARAIDAPAMGAFFDRIAALESAARNQKADAPLGRWRDAYVLPLALAVLFAFLSLLPIRRDAKL